MKTVLTTIALVSLLCAESPHYFNNYFHISDAEISAVADAGVTQTSALSSVVVNPATGALFANNTESEIFLSSGVSYLSDANTSSDKSTSLGNNYQLAYFPPKRNNDFSWGVIVTVNSDKCTVDDIPLSTMSTLWGSASNSNNAGTTTTVGNDTPGTADVDVSITKSNSTFSFAWRDIVSFGIGFDILAMQNDARLFIDTTLENISGPMIQSESSGSKLFVNMGLQAQYRFALSESISMTPAIGGSLLQLRKKKVDPEDVLSVPNNYHFGGSLSLDVKEVVRIETLFDRHSGYSDKKAYTNSFGLELGFLPFGWVRGGYLKEKHNESREELHGGITIGYKAKELHDFFNVHGRTIKKPTKVDNVHILYSFSLIDDLNNEEALRDGQQIHQLTCAIDLKEQHKRSKKRRNAHRSGLKKSIAFAQ